MNNLNITQSQILKNKTTDCDLDMIGSARNSSHNFEPQHFLPSNLVTSKSCHMEAIVHEGIKSVRRKLKKIYTDEKRRAEKYQKMNDEEKESLQKYEKAISGFDLLTPDEIKLCKNPFTGTTFDKCAKKKAKNKKHSNNKPNARSRRPQFSYYSQPNHTLPAALMPRRFWKHAKK